MDRASPSQVPRLPAPGDPRATPRSPGHRATLGRRATAPREEPEEAQPCQQMAQLLATFTKRIQSFFLTLMGFNHPHMERLQIALQQQVQVLASGMMDLMTKHSAFLSLRSAMREGKLWERFRQRHESLFQRGQELKDCEAALQEEQQKAESLKASLVSAQRLLDRRDDISARLNGMAAAKASLSASFQRWQRFASNRLHCRRAASCAQQMHWPCRQAFQLQAAFFQWHRARSSADRWALKELAAKATAGVATAPGPLVEVEKVKAYLHSAEARSAEAKMAAAFLAWRFSLARSQNRSWQEHSEDMCQSMRSNIRQKNLKFCSRLNDATGRLALKVALMRWRAGCAYSAAERWSSEAKLKVAQCSCQVIQRRKEVGCAQLCLAHWNKWTALCKVNRPEQRPPRHNPDTCHDLHFHSRTPLDDQGDRVQLRLERTFQPAQPSSWRPNNYEAHEAQAAVPETAQLASHFATFHQDQVMKHWSLASQASQSEEGYLKLRDFHRELRRRERLHPRGAVPLL